MIKSVLRSIKIGYANIILFFVFAVGVSAILVSTIPYGRLLCLQRICGLWYPNSINARDEMWQLSIASSSFQSFPPTMPGFAGLALSGYHFLYALLLHLASLSEAISLNYLSSFLFPIVWVILYSLLSYKIACTISRSKVFVTIFIFLQFFAGSFGYFLTLYHKGTLLGSEGMNYNPILYLTNKPLALSILLFLWITVILLENRTRGRLVLITFSVFLQWGAKFHGGVALLLLLFGWIATKTVKKEFSVGKSIAYIILLLSVSAIAVLFFYNPFAGHASSAPIRFSPFALVHSIIETKDMIYLKDMVNARYFLYSTGQFSPRLLGIELFSTLLYLFFLLGTRSVALVALIHKLFTREIRDWDVWFWVVILGTGTLMLLFVQNGDWFNTMQFFSFGLILLNIYVALSIKMLLSRINIFKIPITIFFVLLTIPYTVGVVWESTAPFTNKITNNLVYISSNELDALSKLKKMSPGVVFSFLTTSQQIERVKNNPKSIWRADDTSYVTAFSQKQSYLTFVRELRMLGMDPDRRERQVTDPKLDLYSLPVTYYYLLKKHPQFDRVKHQINNVRFKTIYQNPDVILLVKK